jgi:hypothetical protein
MKQNWRARKKVAMFYHKKNLGSQITITNRTTST